MRRLVFPALTVASLALGLTACGEKPAGSVSVPLVASDFQVNINPAPGRPAAGFGMITGGPGVALTGVSSPEAERIEMHIMEMSGEAMRMKKVDALTIDSDGTLAFKSGGRHLMLFGLAEGAADDEEMQLDLVFDDGSKLTTLAAVKR